MDLHRDILERMKEWKESPSRLPLIIKGARQCGKSWCMKEFGRLYYTNTAYFNFESQPELCDDFKTSKEPSRIIANLEIYCGFKIIPGATLIIFDEIQECNEALNSLKYFAEFAPEYHIMSAGSLLGVALSKGGSFPVGKVDCLDMYPLTFKEFLLSADKTLYDYVNGLTHLEILPLRIFNRLNEEYRRYTICGGMPKAVLAMIEDNDLGKVDLELKRITESYSLDFSKHASPSTVPKIAEIWNSLPSQLSKENRKFTYKVVRTGARAREYESALQWLQFAGLVYKIYESSTPIFPLQAYDDISAFKVYVLDIGILRTLCGIPAEIFMSPNISFREFKGAFAENAALQSFVPQFDTMPRYWASEGRAEVDFLLQAKGHIYPVEVKAETNKSGKSLSVYIKKYKPFRAFTITALNVSEGETVINVPHSLSSWLGRWL